MEETHLIFAAIFSATFFIIVLQIYIRDITKSDRETRKIRSQLTDASSEIKNEEELIKHCMDSLNAVLQAKQRIIKTQQKRWGKAQVRVMDRRQKTWTAQPLRQLVTES